jgi:hypothetical protein
MKRKSKRKQKHVAAKSVLRLPDLEVAKSAVLNSLSCPDAQRGYRHAIDEFVEWYCSEPGLSFSKTVVGRYRMHLESSHLASETINLRLGAVRRLAYEASDCGLLSADLAAGIRRVKGLKKLRVRLAQIQLIGCLIFGVGSPPSWIQFAGCTESAGAFFGGA